MEFYLSILVYVTVVARHLQGMVIPPPGPLDRVIQLQLLELTQGSSLADGLVLAGTIVEGGPVFDRPRKILGGKTVHPGHEFIDFAFQLEKCPRFTFGYSCQDWVPAECEVHRHLLYQGRLCSCRVNVC
ncbi:hypothetical protein ACF0H5_015595 [Mactra antiquata]